MSLVLRFKNAWNAFSNRSPTHALSYNSGPGSSIRPDTTAYAFGRTSIINSIYNRISVDAASIGLKHVVVDEADRYTRDVSDGLNRCLTLTANKDQISFSFMIDVVFSMLDEGNIAIIPVDTKLGAPSESSIGSPSFEDIYTMRVAKIKEWYPDSIRVEAYDDNSGIKKELVFPKDEVCIIENPFYNTMNAQDSTAKRLSNKMALLDKIDTKTGSDQLDLIIQVPYSAKSTLRQNLAKQRLDDIEDQLTNSRLGIAYIEATEKITQLNRPVENHIQEQIEYLTKLLFAQLGLTQEILDGTASPETMQNYYSRTVSPILKVIAYEMTRKWISPNAYTRGHRVWFYQKPFELVPLEKMAELVDKFTRNEIMTGNEIRQQLGMKPSDDPRADELRNKNLNASAEEQAPVNDKEKDEGGSNSDAEEV